MTVLNTFLAVAGWVWTVLVVCFAGGYALGYKAGARQKTATNP
jgi:tryptophan-rich sensory protein